MYTTKKYTGEVREFATLSDAVRHIGSKVLSFSDRFQSFYSITRDRLINFGDEYQVRDELGLLVRSDTLKYVYRNLPNEYYHWHWDRKIVAWCADPANFRNGPVPGIRRRRGHRGTYYRRPRTTQERRESFFLEFDEDAIEYGIKARRTGYLTLPTAWDDIPRDCYNKKNWKRYRKTQWKG